MKQEWDGLIVLKKRRDYIQRRYVVFISLARVTRSLKPVDSQQQAAAGERGEELGADNFIV